MRKKRKHYRKCGVCGARYAQDEMIRTDYSPNGWACRGCVAFEYPEYDIEEREEEEGDE